MDKGVFDVDAGLSIRGGTGSPLLKRSRRTRASLINMASPMGGRRHIFSSTNSRARRASSARATMSMPSRPMPNSRRASRASVALARASMRAMSSSARSAKPAMLPQACATEMWRISSAIRLSSCLRSKPRRKAPSMRVSTDRASPSKTASTAAAMVRRSIRPRASVTCKALMATSATAPAKDNT